MRRGRDAKGERGTRKRERWKGGKEDSKEGEMERGKRGLKSGRDGKRGRGRDGKGGKRNSKSMQLCTHTMGHLAHAQSTRPIANMRNSCISPSYFKNSSNPTSDLEPGGGIYPLRGLW